MIKIREAIVVEGKYDKMRVSALFDTVVISTNGFSVFADDEKIKILKQLADTMGIIILTDSDSAGFMIRNYLKSILPADKIKNAYIPKVTGKERRKRQASKENMLGVEGMNDEVLLNSIESAMPESSCETVNNITKCDLFCDGLYGRNNSKIKRKLFLEKLNLPEHINSTNLVKIINMCVVSEKYKNIICEINEEFN